MIALRLNIGNLNKEKAGIGLKNVLSSVRLRRTNRSSGPGKSSAFLTTSLGNILGL
jgi:hypothetical protein